MTQARKTKTRPRTSVVHRPAVEAVVPVAGLMKGFETMSVPRVFKPPCVSRQGWVGAGVRLRVWFV